MNELTTARILRRYRKIAVVTIGAVVFLILVGGIVRSTGAGMGCPDWPKCFGVWIPPTDASQLPDNYQELYQDHGYGSTTFNVVKTWTEYINRLIGVVIGFLIIATYLYSRPVRKYDSRIHWLSLGALVLVVFQGWLGGQVVDTNLMTWLISIHMLVAMAILVALISAYVLAYQDQIRSLKTEIGKEAVWIGVGVAVLSLIQILLGIQVRESVDVVAKELGPESRGDWIANLGEMYAIHRFFYYAVVAGIVVWFWNLRVVIRTHPLYRNLMVSLLAIVGAEVILGLSMHHFAIPAISQPLHLTLATVLFGIEVVLISVLVIQKNTQGTGGDKRNEESLSESV